MIKRIAIATAALGAGGTVLGLGAAGVGAHTTAAGTPDSGKLYSSVDRLSHGVAYAAGNSRDKLLGPGAITAQNTLTPDSGGGETITSKHTVLYTATGSLTGTSSVHVVVTGTNEKFTDGKLRLTSGKGSQDGHSLVATYSGSGSTTANQITFTYRGTYK